MPLLEYKCCLILCFQFSQATSRTQVSLDLLLLDMSAPISIPRRSNNDNVLYVPVHRRSPHSSPISSKSWRSYHDSEKDLKEAQSASPRIYPISQLLQLSFSPLAKLSHSKEREISELLYLSSSWKQSKPKLPSSIPEVVRAIPKPVSRPASAQQLERRRSRNGRRSRPARFDWGYGVRSSEGGKRFEAATATVVLGA